jgi:hypothetical protein
MKLFAKQMGFYKGARVRPGTVFEFDGKEPPKWAAVVGTPAAKVDPPKRLADTRPAAAVKAARLKSAASDAPHTEGV